VSTCRYLAHEFSNFIEQIIPHSDGKQNHDRRMYICQSLHKVFEPKQNAAQVDVDNKRYHPAGAWCAGGAVDGDRCGCVADTRRGWLADGLSKQSKYADRVELVCTKFVTGGSPIDSRQAISAGGGYNIGMLFPSYDSKPP